MMCGIYGSSGRGIETQFRQLSVRRDINRRTLLATLGASTGIGLAGCLSTGGETQTPADTPSDAGGKQSGDTTPAESQTENTDEQTDTRSTPEKSSTESSQTTSDELPTATLKTSRGDIEVKLYAERVPNTVSNFIGLSTGEKAWTDPRTGKRVEGEPLYEDIPFHRVIDDFMIQTGDPTGTGRGGPGYTFDDEFHEDLSHDSAGILSMANRGPDTNGSQFFITLAPQPHLDGRHAVFGTVISGMETVQEIGDVKTDEKDRPINDVMLESVTVHRP